jgi:single-strand DNA-binding protein
VVAWARLAELCHQYLRKGKLVYLEGYLKTRSWEAEGGKRFRTEIVLQDMIMLEKRSDGNGDSDTEFLDSAPQAEEIPTSALEEPTNENIF